MLTEALASIEVLILLPKAALGRRQNGRALPHRQLGDHLSGGSWIVVPHCPPVAAGAPAESTYRLGLRAGDPGIYGSRGETTITLAPEQGIPAQGYRLRIADDGIDLGATCAPEWPSRLPLLGCRSFW